MLVPGSTIGDVSQPSRCYRIVRAVGRGGMGEIYEAVQIQLARRVALKTIRADLASKPELLARFKREAESAAALGHPNLVQVTDFQANSGEAAFLVMEMLDGATLAQVLEQEGRLDPARAAFIALQLLSGLAAAHRAGIVHRDVKPANVFLQSTSVMRDLVKVLDFGVAKLALDATSGGPAMTRAGEVLGTLSYMAPEQATSGAAIDARTDIFGVGATLFHALSGVRPFDATEPGGGRTPLDRIAPWVHRDLAAVIERALQRSPDARWSTADDMAAALQPFASGAGTVPPAPSAPGSDAGHRRSGWDSQAIGRLEAPTGGYPPTGYAPSGYAPTGYAPSSPPRDATLMEHGARAPAPHVSAPPVNPAPPPFASSSSYGPLPGVGSAAPAGAVPIAMSPSGYGYGYGAPHAQQGMHLHPSMTGARRAGPPWWMLVVAVVAVVALAVIASYAFSFLTFRNATNPATIATNVEREVLKQPKQPCPLLEQCNVSTEDHGLTYPTCSKRLPSSSTYRPGEMILGGKDTRVGLITSELGNGRHSVRFLTAQKEVEVGDDEIIGRLCRPGASRAGAGQTLP